MGSYREVDGTEVGAWGASMCAGGGPGEIDVREVCIGECSLGGGGETEGGGTAGAADG
jgi:hypothetical protein